MKKRYQKAPRITNWSRSEVIARNLIKVIETIKEEKMPADLVSAIKALK